MRKVLLHKLMIIFDAQDRLAQEQFPLYSFVNKWYHSFTVFLIVPIMFHLSLLYGSRTCFHVNKICIAHGSIITSVLYSGDEVALEVEQRVLTLPVYPVLISMPRVSLSTTARSLTKVYCRAFASAIHLAAYASLAPKPGIPVRQYVAPPSRGAIPRDEVIQLRHFTFR